MGSIRKKRFVTRCYALLVHVLLPLCFRQLYGRQMVDAFDDLYLDARSRPRFLLRELFGLLRAVWVERRQRSIAKQDKDSVRRRIPLLDALVQNARHAFRGLVKRPAVTVVVVGTLALGIGANTATFSVIRHVLLSPLPYEEPERLVMIFNRWGDWERPHGLSRPEILDYRERAQSFDSIAAFSHSEVNLTGDGEPERLLAGVVTPNLFEVLGVRTVLGRTFRNEDSGAGVTLLSYELWSRRYGQLAEVLGNRILVDGVQREVAGILPPAFALPSDFTGEVRPALYLAARIDGAEPGNRGDHYLGSVGRMGTGVHTEEATAELHAVAQNLTEEGLYKTSMNFSAYAVPIDDFVVGSVRTALFLLLGAVGFVLLIVTANVANLLLAKSEGRRREMAVRAAMGAGRLRLFAQLLLESVMMALAGALLGVGLAAVGLDLLVYLGAEEIPRTQNLALDETVLLFTAAITVGAVILFGLLPAFRFSRLGLQAALRETSRALGGRSGTTLLRVLAVGQIALATTLLVGATLMLRSFWELTQIDPGFQTVNRLTFRVSLPATDYKEVEDVVSFYEQLLPSLENLPGVERAGAGRILPLATRMGTWNLDIEDRPLDPGETRAAAEWQVATPGYIAALGIPLREGRTLSREDRPDRLPVAVVNESFARTHWPNESALEKRIRVGRADKPWLTIVGVVGDVRHNGLDSGTRPRFYVPHNQWPVSRDFAIRDMSVVLQVAGEPEAVLPLAREALANLDPNLPMARARGLDAILVSSVSRPRFTAVLLAIFTALAVLVAAVGVYSVLAYSVSRRVQELGLRMALGADRRSLVRLVLRDALGVALWGALVGTLAAAFLSRLLTSLLYGVSIGDPSSFVLAAVLLLVVATLAALAPALRAAGVNPVEALSRD